MKKRKSKTLFDGVNPLCISLKICNDAYGHVNTVTYLVELKLTYFCTENTVTAQSLTFWFTGPCILWEITLRNLSELCPIVRELAVLPQVTTLLPSSSPQCAQKCVSEVLSRASPVTCPSGLECHLWHISAVWVKWRSELSRAPWSSGRSWCTHSTRRTPGGLLDTGGWVFYTASPQ